MNKTQLKDVFGVAPEISPKSYVDRGGLDEEIQYYLSDNQHIALRGESKCGKSWLIKKNIQNPLVIQCRLKTTVEDIYTEILAHLDIKLILEEKRTTSVVGKVEASTEAGINLIGKVKALISGQASYTTQITAKSAQEDINNLRFIAELIKQSAKRVIIEDFHYLSIEQRKVFAFDLKTLWDYSCFLTIVGVWTQTNLLTYLNPDLLNRVHEISIYWDKKDLLEVLIRGETELNIEFSEDIKNTIIEDCYQNIGLLQTITQIFLKQEKILFKQNEKVKIDNTESLDKACKEFAKQLDARYMRFATDVSKGIRFRQDSTGIYPYALSIILESLDEELMQGVHLDTIYQKAHSRQPRILKVNLKTILGKLEELQVDEGERGLVLAFNKGTNEVSAVDRTLLFYRKHFTTKWPWLELIEELESKETSNTTLDLFNDILDKK